MFNRGYFTEDDIRPVLAMHPAECIFELDAPKNIVARLSAKTKSEWLKLKNLDEFKQCWQSSEIYCPHEGIDRLAECGVKTTEWEIM